MDVSPSGSIFRSHGFHTVVPNIPCIESYWSIFTTSSARYAIVLSTHSRSLRIRGRILLRPSLVKNRTYDLDFLPRPVQTTPGKIRRFFSLSMTIPRAGRKPTDFSSVPMAGAAILYHEKSTAVSSFRLFTGKLGNKNSNATTVSPRTYFLPLLFHTYYSDIIIISLRGEQQFLDGGIYYSWRTREMIPAFVVLFTTLAHPYTNTDTSIYPAAFLHCSPESFSPLSTCRLSFRLLDSAEWEAILRVSLYGWQAHLRVRSLKKCQATAECARLLTLK